MGDGMNENEEAMKTEPNNEVPTEPIKLCGNPKPSRDDMMHMVQIMHDERCDSLAALCQTVEGMNAETMGYLSLALGALDAAADSHMEATGELWTTTRELAARRMGFILDMVGPAAQVALRDRLEAWRV